MAEQGLIGAFQSLAGARTNGTGLAVEIYENTSRLLINHIDVVNANNDLLFFVSPTNQGLLDLNTIIDQCARIRQGQILNLDIGSSRTRPSPGFMYANFITSFAGGSKIVNFGQIVETY